MQVVGGGACLGHTLQHAWLQKGAGPEQRSRPLLTLSSGRLAGEPAGLDSCRVICKEQAGSS